MKVDACTGSGRAGGKHYAAVPGLPSPSSVGDAALFASPRRASATGAQRDLLLMGPCLSVFMLYTFGTLDFRRSTVRGPSASGPRCGSFRQSSRSSATPSVARPGRRSPSGRSSSCSAPRRSGGSCTCCARSCGRGAPRRRLHGARADGAARRVVASRSACLSSASSRAYRKETTRASTRPR